MSESRGKTRIVATGLARHTRAAASKLPQMACLALVAGCCATVAIALACVALRRGSYWNVVAEGRGPYRHTVTHLQWVVFEGPGWKETVLQPRMGAIAYSTNYGGALGEALLFDAPLQQSAPAFISPGSFPESACESEVLSGWAMSRAQMEFEHGHVGVNDTWAIGQYGWPLQWIITHSLYRRRGGSPSPSVFRTPDANRSIAAIAGTGALASVELDVPRALACVSLLGGMCLVLVVASRQLVVSRRLWRGRCHVCGFPLRGENHGRQRCSECGTTVIGRSR